ncbi:MAG: DUF3515 domain-containing protein [Mycobacterium sp.]
MDPEAHDGPPRALLIVAIVVAAGALIGILVYASHQESPTGHQPVAVEETPAPKAGTAECHTLLGALPDRLGGYERAPAAEPSPPGVVAWSSDGEPVVVRCGVDRPAGFVVGSPIQMVDAVQWFEVTEQRRSTWFAVDRPVYVALTLPPGSGPTPIQTLSETIAKTLPPEPIDPAPAR